MSKTLNADLPEPRLSYRLHVATIIAALSGIGALLALSIAVAPVSADRLWTFVFLSVAVLLPGLAVWLYRHWLNRHVGVNELFLQLSFASWLLFSSGLFSPSGMPTIPSTLGLAVPGLVVMTIITLKIRRSTGAPHAEHLRWWLLTRAAFCNLLGAGLLLTPLFIIYWLLQLNSVE